jgi:hypothetical protein
MSEQTSGTVLMVRPARFGFHAEAAQSNVFARNADPAAAGREFDGVVEAIERAGVEVLVLEDSADPKPDAIFPNNWVSFHANGTMVLYPMATAARRIERRADAVADLLGSHRFEVSRTVDLTAHEAQGSFLEGTGSLVLDRPRGAAYACRSIRTDAEAVADFDRQLGFSTLLFDAFDRSGQPIYHTNVLLSLGSEFALLCLEAVAPADRTPMGDRIEASGRTIIEVDYEQMRQFACNAIELRGRGGATVIALSAAAKACFRSDQLRLLDGYGELVEAAIPTIETVGGGSVRCMIADVHLPRN